MRRRTAANRISTHDDVCKPNQTNVIGKGSPIQTVPFHILSGREIQASSMQSVCVHPHHKQHPYSQPRLTNTIPRG